MKSPDSNRTKLSVICSTFHRTVNTPAVRCWSEMHAWHYARLQGILNINKREISPMVCSCYLQCKYTCPALLVQIEGRLVFCVQMCTNLCAIPFHRHKSCTALAGTLIWNLPRTNHLLWENWLWYVCVFAIAVIITMPNPHKRLHLANKPSHHVPWSNMPTACCNEHLTLFYDRGKTFFFFFQSLTSSKFASYTFLAN